MKKILETIDQKKSKLIIFPRVVISLFILIIVLALPLIIISGSKSFYMHRLAENDCYSMISEKDCVDLSMNVLNYLKGQGELDSRYSSSEQSHFRDVKHVLDFAKALALGLSFFVLMYLTLFFVLDKSEIYRLLRLSGIMIISFFSLLLITIAISFNGVFYLFHALLFPQGNWMFLFNSVIIIVFSEGFFVKAAIASFLFSLGTGIILLGVGLLGKKK